MKNFKDAITFITGGASGAGLGQAELFGKLGAKIIIADIRKDHLDKAVAILGEKGVTAYPIELDLTDRQAYAAAADEVERVFGGPPALLIQTAGVNTFGPAEASTYEDYDWVMGVCLGAVINGMITFVPRMIKAYGNGKREAHICCVSSMGAFMGCRTCAPYSAAKAAVVNLMDSYYQSLKPYGIGVTVQCPGNINSNIWDAVATRPAHLQNTGYHVSEETKAVLKSIHAAGQDPVDLATWLKNAIEAEQLLCIPFPGGDQMLRGLYEKYINYASPEGMKKNEEEEKKQAEAMHQMQQAVPDVGYGKAKGDIDWVRDEQKFKVTQ